MSHDLLTDLVHAQRACEREAVRHLTVIRNRIQGSIIRKLKEVFSYGDNQNSKGVRIFSQDVHGGRDWAAVTQVFDARETGDLHAVPET